MKTVLLASLFLAVAMASAQARLGEGMSQLTERYGDALPKSEKTPPNPLGTVAETFQKNGFQIDVTLLDRVSARESFKKLNGDAFTSQEVETLLGDNAQGRAWQAPQRANGQTRWMRDDGAVATLAEGKTLTITATNLLNAEATVKQLDKTPSLDGF